MFPQKATGKKQRRHFLSAINHKKSGRQTHGIQKLPNILFLTSNPDDVAYRGFDRDAGQVDELDSIGGHGHDVQHLAGMIAILITWLA